MFSDSTLGISLSTFLEIGLKPADVGIAASFSYGGHEIVLLVFYCIIKFCLSVIRDTASGDVRILEARREDLRTRSLCSVGTVVFDEVSTRLPFVRISLG